MDGVEGLFHLAGRRGSIGIQRTQAATMLGENLMICLNVLDAAQREGVERILYTSTVTVYPPMEVYREDLVWSANPHPGDQYAAWAKRMAEKFIEAQEVQHGSMNTAIVRPVNTFGPHDNFDPKTALVVPALIGRALSGENPFVVWGDGSAVRDFLYVSDAVDGMLLAFEKGIGLGAFNLGSGHGTSIRDLVTHPCSGICQSHPVSRARSPISPARNSYLGFHRKRTSTRRSRAQLPGTVAGGEHEGVSRFAEPARGVDSCTIRPQRGGEGR
jgi:GDP-L-fucose synthase